MGYQKSEANKINKSKHDKKILKPGYSSIRKKRSVSAKGSAVDARPMPIAAENIDLVVSLSADTPTVVHNICADDFEQMVKISNVSSHKREKQEHEICTSSKFEAKIINFETGEPVPASSSHNGGNPRPIAATQESEATKIMFQDIFEVIENQIQEENVNKLALPSIDENSIKAPIQGINSIEDCSFPCSDALSLPVLPCSSYADAWQPPDLTNTLCSIKSEPVDHIPENINRTSLQVTHNNYNNSMINESPKILKDLSHHLGFDTMSLSAASNHQGYDICYVKPANDSNSPTEHQELPSYTSSHSSVVGEQSKYSGQMPHVVNDYCNAHNKSWQYQTCDTDSWMYQSTTIDYGTWWDMKSEPCTHHDTLRYGMQASITRFYKLTNY